MTNYHFETREFGISDNGIHLLRSRFNYETIEFAQVHDVTIERGKELNNWMAILLIGLALVTFTAFYCLKLFNVLHNNEDVIYAEQIVIPILPLMLGGYCIYSSTRNGIILRIRTTKSKAEKFPLKELEKDNKLGPFQDFLKEKLHTKIRINT